MSLKQLKNDFLDSSSGIQKSIEEYLQNIVNISSQVLEVVELPSNDFVKIEEQFEQSNTFEEVLQIIQKMSSLTLKQAKKIKLLNSSKKKAEEQLNHKVNPSDSLLASSKYDDLEKLLQKYEAEIREHIKIEQQMKIYSDSLEEKITEMELTNDESTQKIKVLEKEVSKIQSELEGLRVEKQNSKAVVKINNSKGLAISVPRHRKTQSIDTVI